MKKFDKSTLFMALRSIEVHKLQHFERYLTTSEKNGTDSVMLFAVLKPYLYPKLRPFPEQADLLQQVFGDGVVKVQNLRYAMSKLLASLEKWLVIDYILHDPTQRASMLAKAYENLRFGEGVRRAEQQLEKEQKASGLQNDQYVFERYQIEWAFFNSPTDIAQAEVPEKLDVLIENLDKFYVGRQLQQFGIRLAYDSISKGGTMDKKRLAGFVQIVEREQMQTKEPFIHLYLLVVKMQIEPSDPTHFQQFVELLYQHIHIFPQQEAWSLWIFAINFCMRNINEGASYHRVMELYDVGLKRAVLTKDGKVTQTTFLNAVKYGLKMNETQRMEDFLEKYQGLLDPSEAENTILESKARIAFSKKEYTKAIAFLTGVKHQGLLQELSLRLFQFRILYEMEDLDNLERHLHALSIFFLRRKKQLGYHQKSLNNYIKAATRLLKMNRLVKSERIGFEDYVRGLSPIFEREWFLEMCV